MSLYTENRPGLPPVSGNWTREGEIGVEGREEEGGREGGIEEQSLLLCRGQRGGPAAGLERAPPSPPPGARRDALHGDHVAAARVIVVSP